LEKALPSREPKGFNLIEVAADRFYESLAELHFEHSAENKNPRSLIRKLGAANGMMANPASSDRETALSVQPPMLDGAIQSVILAYR
jgi:hypothetical protein